MTPYYADGAVTLYAGDCLDVLPTLPDCSVDAVVTDPPYGLEFMGKEWDSFKARGSSALLHSPKDEGREFTNDSGHMWDNTKALPRFPGAGLPFQQWCQLWAEQCLRVLKPGGHLLAFGGTRTWHRLAVAIEDAGFEVRDTIAWLYGSGFPKSLDVSKAIDRLAGAEREVIGERSYAGGHIQRSNGTDLGVINDDGWHGGIAPRMDTAPATADAQRWQGWGTALKPAHEPICVARKPLIGTVAANVLAHGTGALNIDGCRIAGAVPVVPQSRFGGSNNNIRTAGRSGEPSEANPAGRWPANVALDETAAAALDHMSGELHGAGSAQGPQERWNPSAAEGWGNFGSGPGIAGARFGDAGGASRFFYTAKAGSDERITHDGVAHPTVKPLSLMRWLVRLVTPPGGLILDPFAGSGTTVEAAILEGFRCIAIEREADYLPLITQRLNRRRNPVAYLTAAGEDLGLFDEEPA